MGGKQNVACIHVGCVFILYARSFVAMAQIQHSRNTDVEKDLYHTCQLPTYSSLVIAFYSQGYYLLDSLVMDHFQSRSHTQGCDTLILTPRTLPYTAKSWDYTLY